MIYTKHIRWSSQQREGSWLLDYGRILAIHQLKRVESSAVLLSVLPSFAGYINPITYGQYYLPIIHQQIGWYEVPRLHVFRHLSLERMSSPPTNNLHQACFRNRKHYRRLQIAMSSQQTSMGDSVVCFQEDDKPAVEITRCGPLRRPYESSPVKVRVLDDGSEFICDRRAIDPMEISPSESLLNPPWNLISHCLSKILQERLP